MTNNRLFNYCLVCACILITGLGSALVLPWLASLQGLAARSDVGEQVKALEVTRYYVAKTGDGSDGSSWSKAFTKLQDALSAASSGDEIWVAAGIYTPGINISDTFGLVPGVAVYGGFDTSDTQLSDRDWQTNVTVLSGDIGSDDLSNGNGVVTSVADINGDNSDTVVTARGVTSTAVLDGFTITAGQGQASGSDYPWDPRNSGGGFYCDGDLSGGCSPSLSNIIFSANYARNGGAMCNFDSSPSLKDVVFYHNLANNGGAMSNNSDLHGGSSPSLMNVLFYSNKATGAGGAMFNDASGGGSSPNMINVVFSGNSAESGGAMYNIGEGYDYFCNPILTNATFSGNSASGAGGAMLNVWSYPDVRNSILWNNMDSSGTDTISATIYNNFNAAISLTHSLVQGAGASGSSSWISDPSYKDGGGNIDQDPMFITPVDPASAPTSEGNLRLKSGSPAIDTGNRSYVTGVPADLDGNPRIVDGDSDGTAIVDMGAYEYQGEEVYLPLIYR